MPRIATHKTLRANRKSRLNYAYQAMERDLFSGDAETEKTALEAMRSLHTMNLHTSMMWACREIEYKQLTEEG